MAQLELSVTVSQSVMYTWADGNPYNSEVYLDGFNSVGNLLGIMNSSIGGSVSPEGATVGGHAVLALLVGGGSYQERASVTLVLDGDAPAALIQGVAIPGMTATLDGGSAVRLFGGSYTTFVWETTGEGWPVPEWTWAEGVRTATITYAGAVPAFWTNYRHTFEQTEPEPVPPTATTFAAVPTGDPAYYEYPDDYDAPSLGYSVIRHFDDNSTPGRIIEDSVGLLDFVWTAEGWASYGVPTDAGWLQISLAGDTRDTLVSVTLPSGATLAAVDATEVHFLDSDGGQTNYVWGAWDTFPVSGEGLWNPDVLGGDQIVTVAYEFDE